MSEEKPEYKADEKQVPDNSVIASEAKQSAGNELAAATARITALEAVRCRKGFRLDRS